MYARDFKAPSRQQWRNQHGFTLLELSVALAIAGVLATIAVPNLSLMAQRMQSQRSITEVTTFVEKARSQAHISLTPATLTLTGRILEADQGGTVFDSIELDDTLTVMSINTPSSTLTFNSGGGHDEGGPISMHISTQMGDTEVLLIFPAIGSVRRHKL